MKNLSRKNNLFWQAGRTRFFWLTALVLLAASGCTGRASNRGMSANGALIMTENSPLVYILPPPITDGSVSVERALANRRSHRRFQDRALSAQQLSQILWAAYGITEPMPGHPGLRGGLRTTPSAGAMFPLEIYVVIGNVTGIEPGVYRYISQQHQIVRTINRDVREELSRAALGQTMIRDAPVTIVHTGVLSRLTGRYGQRGQRYLWIEVGHSAQNIYLQAEALGLGTCAVGAFMDNMVSELLQLPAEEEPLYLMPVGYVR